MAHLTSAERITRIFQNKEIDRPALKLWGASFETRYLLDPAYKPVAELAAETSDLFVNVGFTFNIIAGSNTNRYVEQYTTETKSPDWVHRHTVYHTPKGDLHEIRQVSTKREPGFIVEHMVKEPEDIDKLLSMEYAPFSIDRTKYDKAVARMCDSRK